MYWQIFSLSCILFYNFYYFKFLYKRNDKLNVSNLVFEESCSLEIFKNNSNNNKSDTVILIFPGGAYKFVADREGKPVAQRFLSYGYSCAVLTYKVGYGCYPTNFIQGLKSIKYLSKIFKKIVLMGFSAGGHLAGFLGTSKRPELPSINIL